jgi:phage baseplate assembly protein V
VSTSLLDLVADAAHQRDSRIHGVVIGVVTNNKDDQGLGRVKVRFPWLSGAVESHWARVATPMAGNGRGLYSLPEVDDEVLVLFDRGDVRFPFVIGALWNGKDKAPSSNSDGHNSERVIKSRSGHVIRLTDESGAEKVEIVDASGKNRVVIDTAANAVTVSAETRVVLSAPHGDVRIEARQLAIAVDSAKVEVKDALAIHAGGALAITGQTIDLN